MFLSNQWFLLFVEFFNISCVPHFVFFSLPLGIRENCTLSVQIKQDNWSKGLYKLKMYQIRSVAFGKLEIFGKLSIIFSAHSLWTILRIQISDASLFCEFSFYFFCKNYFKKNPFTRFLWIITKHICKCTLNTDGQIVFPKFIPIPWL